MSRHVSYPLAAFELPRAAAVGGFPGGVEGHTVPASNAPLSGKLTRKVRTSMAKVTYIEFNGNEHVVDVAPGFSVMQGALNNSVRGVIAECGGACSCATCHVYVDSAWIDKLDQKTEEETAMLDAVCEPQPNSRLSCQIKMTERLDGLVVRMPQKQV